MNDYEKFLKLHGVYEKKNYNILIRMFRKVLKALGFGFLTFENAERVLIDSIDSNVIRKALFDVHYSTSISYGGLVKKDIDKIERLLISANPKPNSLFSTRVQSYLINYYDKKGGELITSIKDTLVKSVVAEIRNGTVENETVAQMTTRIQKVVNKPDFYRWQASRVARTETTFAMNSAKLKVIEDGNLLYDKIWKTIVDGRERKTHLEMYGKKVGYNERFVLSSGVSMLFPGDSVTATGANVVGELANCRCSWAYSPKKDSNGLYVLNI